MNPIRSRQRGDTRRVVPRIEVLALVIAIVLPLWLDDFWTLFVTRVFILGLLALSFDLVWGFAGILSFGQALFFGMAGYGTALLATKLQITSLFVVLPIAAVIGLAVAFLLGLLVIVGRGQNSFVFVALGTLTGSYVMERLARGWSYVGGQNGIPSLPRLTVGNSSLEEGLHFYYLALTLLLAVYVCLRLITRSQFGLVLAGIRQSEPRLEFFGYRTQNYKCITFCLGGLVAGLAGGLYTFHEGYVGPGQLGPLLSTQIVVYTLLGGAGTLIGSILGTSLVDLFSYHLSRFWPAGWPVILGLLLLAVIMVRPTGLTGFFVSPRERAGAYGRWEDAATLTRPESSNESP